MSAMQDSFFQNIGIAQAQNTQVQTLRGMPSASEDIVDVVFTGSITGSKRSSQNWLIMQAKTTGPNEYSWPTNSRLASISLMQEQFSTAPTKQPRKRHSREVRIRLENLQLKRTAKTQSELEADWLTHNRQRYAGEWIAIEGDRLISHSRIAKEVFKAVKEANIKALVLQVEAEDLPFAGW